MKEIVRCFGECDRLVGRQIVRRRVVLRQHGDVDAGLVHVLDAAVGHVVEHGLDRTRPRRNRVAQRGRREMLFDCDDLTGHELSSSLLTKMAGQKARPSRLRTLQAVRR